MIDRVAVAAYDRNFHAGNGQHLAGMRDHVFGFSASQHLLVVRIDLRGSSAGFDTGAVIDERSNGNPAGQLGHAPRMVSVIVGQQYVVDLAYARTFGGSQDTARVPAVIARPSGINEQRFAGRGYK